MSEPIDHYAKAVELAATAEDLLWRMVGKAEDAAAFVQLGHLHLDLHHGQPQVQVDTVGDYWELAGQLETLRATVQPALAYLDQTPGGHAIAVQLRKLVR